MHVLAIIVLELLFSVQRITMIVHWRQPTHSVSCSTPWCTMPLHVTTCVIELVSFHCQTIFYDTSFTTKPNFMTHIHITENGQFHLDYWHHKPKIDVLPIYWLHSIIWCVINLLGATWMQECISYGIEPCKRRSRFAKMTQKSNAWWTKMFLNLLWLSCHQPQSIKSNAPWCIICSADTVQGFLTVIQKEHFCEDSSWRGHWSK